MAAPIFIREYKMIYIANRMVCDASHSQVREDLVNAP